MHAVPTRRSSVQNDIPQLHVFTSVRPYTLESTYVSIHLWYLPSPGASCYFWWFKQYQNHWALRLLKPVSCRRCHVIWLLGSLKVPSQDTRESTDIIDCWEEPCFSMCARERQSQRDVGRRYKRLKGGDTELYTCQDSLRPRAFGQQAWIYSTIAQSNRLEYTMKT